MESESHVRFRLRQHDLRRPQLGHTSITRGSLTIGNWLIRRAERANSCVFDFHHPLQNPCRLIPNRENGTTPPAYGERSRHVCGGNCQL
jgi:hypothetical protein